MLFYAMPSLYIPLLWKNLLLCSQYTLLLLKIGIFLISYYTLFILHYPCIINNGKIFMSSPPNHLPTWQIGFTVLFLVLVTFLLLYLDLKLNIKWYYMTSIRKQSQAHTQTQALPPCTDIVAALFLLCICHVHIHQQQTHVSPFQEAWICWWRLTARSAGELISLNQCWRKLMDKHTSYSSPWLG